ncbi:MAG: DNA-3-methyladenine glycosylase [Anaerolineales bacterium]
MLPRAFYEQDTRRVARNLLGQILTHHLPDGSLLRGIILETEAYIGEDDLACHARAGLTPRTRIMYGAPGMAYVYFNYGMHWLFNCVTERAGFPAAVLIRAVFPIQGIAQIACNRPAIPRRHWADGPAKLCRALQITGSHNGADLCAPNSTLYIAAGIPIPEENVTIAPRVGLKTVPEPWRSIAWRWRIDPVTAQNALRNTCQISIPLHSEETL